MDCAHHIELFVLKMVKPFVCQPQPNKKAQADVKHRDALPHLKQLTYCSERASHSSTTEYAKIIFYNLAENHNETIGLDARTGKDDGTHRGP